MLIQNLEKKTRLALFTVCAAVAGSVIICISCLMFCMKLVSDERKNIYVLDGDIPFLAERASLEANYLTEAKAHIQLFHQYFFTLPPDDEYIRYTTGKALYLADGSALKQKQAMEESGFYSDLVASSAFCTVVCDSIKLDNDNRQFTYYGTQYIKRRTTSQRRSLVTVGNLDNVVRTPNNPHGLLITSWRTLKNEDLQPGQ